MALALARRVGRESYVQGDLDVVWHQIEAANSIPEGAPVGTIARRPDGKNIALRVSDGERPYWVYLYGKHWDTADSWPVIYDPREYEGTEYDPETGLHWFKPGEEPLVPRPDPTAQQEPGESLSRGLDDLAAGRVSRRDDYLEPQQEPATTHPVSPESTNCVPKPRTPRVVDRQQEPALRERFPEQASAYVADPELVEVDDEPLPSGSLITPKPRTPRVVDRLGVDEQGSRWVNGEGVTYWFEDDRWYNQAEDEDTPFEFSVGYAPASEAPYTEIVEPRELPSLDCEEARDGTVWEARYVLLAGREQTPGWKFQHTQDGWVYEDGSRVLSPEFLTGRGPYTEVLGDPS